PGRGPGRLEVPVDGFIRAAGLDGELRRERLLERQGRRLAGAREAREGPGHEERSQGRGQAARRAGTAARGRPGRAAPGHRKISQCHASTLSQATDPMSLVAIGLNHQTAPVELRERVAFAGDRLQAALASLRTLPGVEEVALLSTCNRTELYAVADDGGRALANWLATHPEDPVGGAASLRAYLYRHADDAAARHLFRVATGLDSMVLGEPEILGQVKQAWAAARGAGTLGSRLDRLFQHAFVTAKRARTETRIGNSPVSLASMAVRLAQDSFARPEDSVVLLVGAGETIELAARHLAAAGVKRMMVANRTFRHAEELAHRHGGTALPLEELHHHLHLADIVF